MPRRSPRGPTRSRFHFFWACCINLVGAASLRLLLSAPRPFMYDQRLRPLTDLYETSHGLPSLETHMATVVAGWWAESGGGGGSAGSNGDHNVQPLVRLLASGYICFVAFTRVYACSRFVHQVALSIVTGMVGLALGWQLSTHLDGLGLLVRHHVRGTVVVFIIALGMIAYQVENNESQMMGIRKKEYLRVLTNIVKESQKAQSAIVVGAEGNEAEDGEWVLQDDAPWDGRTASSIQRRRQLEERRDSFYFLQRAIERRGLEKHSPARPNANTNQHAPLRSTRFDALGERTSGVGDFDWTGRRRETVGYRLRGGRGTEGDRSRDGDRFFAEAEKAWGASLR